MLLPRCLVATLVAAAFLAPPGIAHATVVERIVAVVGERVILLSDVRERAHPFLAQIYGQVPQGAQRNAAISQLYKGLVERMIDEEIEAKAAAQAKVNVTAREVEEALQRVAQQNNVDVERLIQEAQRSGLDMAAYRDELRRQLLQTKLINVRLQGRIRVTEDDLRNAYRRLELEEREKLSFRAAWVLVPSGAGTSGRELAEHVARQAKTGDFAELARRYSSDPATKSAGGVMPFTRLENVPVALRRVLVGLEEGATAGPIPAPGGYAVVKLIEREETTLPPYEEARNELSQRVYLEKMNQARRNWLDNLRRQQHVEVRM